MKLLAPEEQFYPVINLCKATKRWIQQLPSAERYMKVADWCVHETQIPELFQRAKATGFHETLDYSTASQGLKDRIDQALGKRRVVTPSLKSDTPHTLLHITETAPLWLIEAAWKAFVKNQHPDVGGDSDNFVKVKAAYESLRRHTGS